MPRRTLLAQTAKLVHLHAGESGHCPGSLCTRGSLPSRTCSSKLRQQTRNLTVVDAPTHGSPGSNGAQRGPLHHFASKGLGVRGPLGSTPSWRWVVSKPGVRACLVHPWSGGRADLLGFDVSRWCWLGAHTDGMRPRDHDHGSARLAMAQPITPPLLAAGPQLLAIAPGGRSWRLGPCPSRAR